MSAQPKIKYTLAEYLEMDRLSEARLEYWDGEIFDMSGISKEHDQLDGNLYFHLRTKLHGRRCRVCLANTRIKVPSHPPYRYGDMSALCEPPRYEKIGGVDVLVNPALIVEVLSSSTAAYDRKDKFTHYKSIPSFREYLLIAQDRLSITHFVKQDDGSWLEREYHDPNAALRIVSLECELTLREIYDNFIIDGATPTGGLRLIE